MAAFITYRATTIFIEEWKLRTRAGTQGQLRYTTERIQLMSIENPRSDSGPITTGSFKIPLESRPTPSSSTYCRWDRFRYESRGSLPNCSSDLTIAVHRRSLELVGVPLGPCCPFQDYFRMFVCTESHYYVSLYAWMLISMPLYSLINTVSLPR